jgi:hypothetical protein
MMVYSYVFVGKCIVYSVCGYVYICYIYIMYIYVMYIYVCVCVVSIRVSKIAPYTRKLSTGWARK